MRILLLILTSLLFLSCSRNYEVFIEPDLQPYYARFQEEADRLGVKLNIKDVVLYVGQPYYGGKRAKGLCTYTKHGCSIEIDSALFKGDYKTYSLRVEQTVFHELGHGVLGRDHNRIHYVMVDGTRSFPVSIMTIGNYHYISNREYYVSELFGKIEDYVKYAKEIGYEVVDW